MGPAFGLPAGRLEAHPIGSPGDIELARRDVQPSTDAMRVGGSLSATTSLALCWRSSGRLGRP
jgi:hypothetical protein